MRKLMAVGLMLCILTLLVSGASAASYRGGNFHGSISLSGNSNAYAASTYMPSYATTSAYTQLGTGPNGLTAVGVTQAYASGSSACASSDQTLSVYYF
jgi:hypothetical protein